ncbi:MAG: site-specific DNA-methyltransferase, partial [Quinella sp. 1Q7]|nr:site-specific DNA-methyltransferase [Quinella sp. 1Q7]
KGNNLLALASLTKRFTGRVKLIYIDPPYNTGSDSFGYNDRFRHSTWLTFMTNRLNIARELLSDDGSIWISIDDDEGHYLKVLSDEIFGRDNFVAAVHWHKNYASANDSKTFSTVLDCILVYRKTSAFTRNLLPRTDKQNHLYKYDSNDGMGRWRPDNLSVRTYTAAYDYPIKNPNTGVIYNPPKGRCWMTNQETVQQWIRDGRIFFGQKGDGAPQLKRYLNEVQDGTVPTTYWSFDECGHNDEARKEIKKLFDKDLFGTPKPERLLERILTLATNAGDLVLDYHVGSGTTAAVAHKMGRRYIGVEQMNYIRTLTVERLVKVIGGEGGGISGRVGWTGGGSFVYCELASLNQKFVDAIECATDNATLSAILKQMLATGFISHKVNPAKIEASADEFAALTLDGQKRFLLELLDKNLLYVNLSDLDDAEFAVADSDKQFTRSFYFNSDTTSPPTASAMAPNPTTAAIVRL